MKKILFFSLAIIIYVGVVNAQDFELHTGLTFPSGDFAGDYFQNDKAGSASAGFNLGMKSYLPLSNTKLSVVAGLDIFYNGLQSEYKDQWRKQFSNNGSSDYELTFPVYINIPLFVGLNYSYPLSGDNFKIYGEATLGYNLSHMTSYKIKVKNENAEMEQTYDLSFGFCYGFECGILIKRFKLGFRYNELGNYEYATERRTYLNDVEEFSDNGIKKLAISNCQLVLGINF
jgi:hypothetical protein